MAINQPIQRLWQERQAHSIYQAARRWQCDPKGQTLTSAERKRAKARAEYERQCLSGK